MQWQTEYPPNTDEIRAFIRESVHHSRVANDGLTFAVRLEPGDATHYELFGMYRSRSLSQELWWIGFMVGTDRGGSAVLPMDGTLHEVDVADALNIRSDHSARVLADWLNYFALTLQREKGTAPEEENDRVWEDVEAEVDRVDRSIEHADQLGDTPDDMEMGEDHWHSAPEPPEEPPYDAS